MGMAKNVGHHLKAIYSNLSELNIKFFIKHTKSVADKLIEIKKPPENLSINPRDTTSVVYGIRNPEFGIGVF